MKRPSKEFKEIIPEGEAQLFESYIATLTALQKAKSKKFGKGRLLHRKGIMGLNARLEVLPSLPVYACQGIFAKPSTFPAIIRLSNGGLDVKNDSAPDIRGFAVKVQKVSGKSVLDGSDQTEQDFLMINHSKFSVARAEDFLDMLVALSKGPLALFSTMAKRHGFFGMFGALGNLSKLMGKKFDGFMAETFSTAVPVQIGDYAAKVRIRPLDNEYIQADKSDLSLQVKKHLQQKDITYEMQLQFFVDEETTSLEDGSKEWPEEESPFITVAHLIIPQQPTDGAAFDDLQAQVELLKFDPWNAITEHKPLGNIMRARKAAYFASQKTRGVA